SLFDHLVGAAAHGDRLDWLNDGSLGLSSACSRIDGRKIALDLNAPAEFPVLDESAKAAELLMRLGQSDSVTLSRNEVDAVARAVHLNPRSELPHHLGLLETRRLIDRSAAEVRVLGVTTRATLSHACDILSDAGPTAYEEAAIDLAEST